MVNPEVKPPTPNTPGTAHIRSAREQKEFKEIKAAIDEEARQEDIKLRAEEMDREAQAKQESTANELRDTAQTSSAE